MKKKKKKERIIIIHRDAKTGRFVKEDYVNKHPDTTVTERRKIKPK